MPIHIDLLFLIDLYWLMMTDMTDIWLIYGCYMTDIWRSVTSSPGQSFLYLLALKQTFISYVCLNMCSPLWTSSFKLEAIIPFLYSLMRSVTCHHHHYHRQYPSIFTDDSILFLKSSSWFFCSCLTSKVHTHPCNMRAQSHGHPSDALILSDRLGVSVIQCQEAQWAFNKNIINNNHNHLQGQLMQ